MRVEGRLGQVWACLDDPGQLYGCGKMVQDTKLLVYGIFDASSSKKYRLDLSTRYYILYSHRGRLIGQSCGIFTVSRPIVRQSQDRSKHWFLKTKWKNRVEGGGGVRWGLKSGQAHALGCPEWIPWGYGSRDSWREYVLGTLWWFLCPSAPIHTIHSYTDNISAYTCILMHIPKYTYIYIDIHIKYTLGGKPYTYCSIIPTRYNLIPTDTCQYTHIPTPQIIPIWYLQIYAIPGHTYREHTYRYARWPLMFW